MIFAHSALYVHGYGYICLLCFVVTHNLITYFGSYLFDIFAAVTFRQYQVRLVQFFFIFVVTYKLHALFGHSFFHMVTIFFVGFT